MTVLYSGGGTLGSVSPLLAVHAECLRADGYRGVWVGLDLPKEKAFVAGRGLQEYTITSPRFRNYEGQGLSVTLLTFPFRFAKACFEVWKILHVEHPSVHVSAGSFVSIPVALMCAVKGIPNVVHQQDLLPGLANRVMAKLAKRVTVAFEVLRAGFGEKAVVTGNPARAEILGGDAERARKAFGLVAELPTVFVVGGSSGAQGLNDMIAQIAPKLSEQANVIHMTGSGEREQRGTYIRVPFLGEELKDVYAVSDVVVLRAGMSSVTELGVLGKPMILVPGPFHQRTNAEFFASQGAARMVTQEEGAEHLLGEITLLLEVPAKSASLSAKVRELFPTDAGMRMAKVVREISAATRA